MAPGLDGRHTEHPTAWSLRKDGIDRRCTGTVLYRRVDVGSQPLFGEHRRQESGLVV